MQKGILTVDKCDGDYQTDYLGWNGESFVKWTKNFGKLGSAEMMEGKWREIYTIPEEISENEAYAWLCKYGYSPGDAIFEMADASDMREDDLIEAVGKKCSDDIYKIADNWYACVKEYRECRAGGGISYFDTLTEAEAERDS